MVLILVRYLYKRNMVVQAVFSAGNLYDFLPTGRTILYNTLSSNYIVNFNKSIIRLTVNSERMANMLKE